MSVPYGVINDERSRYTCSRTTETIIIDGRLEESVWGRVQHSPRLSDMVTGAPALLDTRVACLWDELNLYIAFRMEEPDLQARLAMRDDLVYLENDIEIFVAGTDCYYELEINALGTVYEAFFVWHDAYRKGSVFAESPGLDLKAGRVDILGGFQDHFDHPRGPRWVFRDWDFPGLKTAVQIDGTLNDSTDIDRGWSAEIALPWRGMSLMADGRSLPPKDGDTWLMNFFRFEALHANGRDLAPSIGWSWGLHGVYDSHVPECFVEVTFSDQPA